MTTDEAAAILKKMIDKGKATNESVAQIRLFGIKIAKELEGMSLPEIVARAGVSESYKTEIRKGIVLSRFVEIK